MKHTHNSHNFWKLFTILLCLPLVAFAMENYNDGKNSGSLYISKVSNMTVRVKSSSSEYHAGPTLPSDGKMGSFNNVKNSDKVYLGDTTSDFHLHLNITKPKSPPKARPPKPKPAPPPPPRGGGSVLYTWSTTKGSLNLGFYTGNLTYSVNSGNAFTNGWNISLPSNRTAIISGPCGNSVTYSLGFGSGGNICGVNVSFVDVGGGYGIYDWTISAGSYTN